MSTKTAQIDIDEETEYSATEQRRSRARREPERRRTVAGWLGTDRPAGKQRSDDDAVYKIVAKYARRSSTFWPKPQTTWRDYAAVALNAELEKPYRLLKVLSKRDPAGIEGLLSLAVDATKKLKALSVDKPEMIRSIARRRFLWPFLHGPKPCYSDDFASIVKSIDLASETPFDWAKAERMPARSRTARIAIELLCNLQDCRHFLSFLAIRKPRKWQFAAIRLKPFGPDTYGDWAKAAWLLLNDDFDDHPEKDPTLRQIGAYRIDHRQNFEGTITTEQGIRDGIRESLQKKIKHLASTIDNPK